MLILSYFRNFLILFVKMILYPQFSGELVQGLNSFYLILNTEIGLR